VADERPTDGPGGLRRTSGIGALLVAAVFAVIVVANVSRTDPASRVPIIVIVVIGWTVSALVVYRRSRRG